MSATYIIDGYNLLHAMGVLSGPVGPHGLEKARQRLLGLLAGTFADEAPAVTVVFDAGKAPPGVSPEIDYRGVHVVFAVGSKEADDVIEQLLRSAAAPKSIHVVSDDQRVRQAARRRQGVALGCEDFLAWVDRRRRERKAQAAEAPEKRNKISADELQAWLAEFADVERDPSLRQAFERYEFEE
jgi:predicted RNA-binding protein with PIN domain